MVFSPGHSLGHEAEHQALASRMLAAENTRAIRNYIINGDMQVTQRFAAGGGAVVNGQYIVDRWQFIRDGTAGTVAMGQIVFGVGSVLDGEPTSFVRINQSVAGTTQTFKGMQQKIEDVQQLAGQTVTVSFWARSSLATTLQARLTQFFGPGGSTAVSPPDAFFPVLANTWTRCQFTATLGSCLGKTLVSPTDTRLLLFDQSANGGLAQVLDYAQVSVVLGSQSVPFWAVKRSFGEEYALCLRYYQKSFAYGTTPVQNVGVTAGALRGMNVVAGAVSTFLSQPFQAPMRAAPALTFYNPAAANALARNTSAGTDSTATVAGGPNSDKLLAVDVTGAAAWAVGSAVAVHWAADIEL